MSLPPSPKAYRYNATDHLTRTDSLSQYSDQGYHPEVLTVWLHRTLEDLHASNSITFTTTLRLFMLQSRVRVLVAMGDCSQSGGDTEVLDATRAIFSVSCTPDDLQDLSAAMGTFPPNSSSDQELFRALLYTHREWEKRRTQTTPGRSGARQRRRRELFKRRYSACENTPELRELAPGLECWGVDVVSEDESSGEDSGYFIRRIEWRSAEVTTFMRSLDAIDLSRRFVKGKLGRGSVPRERYPSLRLGSTTPKPRLPLNFYSKAWWETLRDDEKESLQAKEPLGLRFSGEVQRTVDRFEVG